MIRNDLQNDNEVFDSKETARILRISPVTLWRLRKTRKIAFRRIAGKVLFLAKDIKECLDSNRQDIILKQRS